ncbi:MAG: citrate lyase acyl carrier protein [Clostridia bacterium]|nr:citrate lyase acyl carrier protein [Clostridia bacterium]MBP3588012.1 citrate lyase acyl carrier protein [Clostridia bacterium]MBQ2382466.1 citrate lyase acyl carrier protein [Oscillospiraceae bacterium]MBQ8801004.1 citrate lyase acyl carrier protein [Clostridium sp.]
MSEVLKPASAGTMESSDVLVELVPAEGREIQLTSVVEAQFGDSIRAVADEMLNQFDLQNVCLRIDDRGALECVLRARIETAILRAKGEN